MNKLVEDSVTSNGGLYNPTRYVDWELGDETITLDGDFTQEELRALADHMENTHG